MNTAEDCFGQCGLELHSTVSNPDKQLQVYTPSGRVGGDRASSGPLVDSIGKWDICSTETSPSSYRLQILNSVAGVDELSGLKTVDGHALLVDNRPQCADDAVEHETNLKRQHSAEFDELNAAIREGIDNVGKAIRGRGCQIVKPEGRAITLGQWRSLVLRIKGEYAVQREQFQNHLIGSEHDWADKNPISETSAAANIRTLKKLFFIPWIMEHQCSYVEQIADGPQLPNYHVSVAFETTFEDLTASIECFAEALQLADSHTLSIYWLTMSTEQLSKAATEWQEVADTNMYKSMQECQGLLNVLDTSPEEAAAEMNRVWRLAELEIAVS